MRSLRPGLLRLVLGTRLPRSSGQIVVPGLIGAVRIARDDFGIPHISADHDADAWLALGFCQAQDRAFQLELLRRVVSGTLAELVGPEGLRIDRLARRIGFRARSRAPAPRA